MRWARILFMWSRLRFCMISGQLDTTREAGGSGRAAIDWPIGMLEQGLGEDKRKVGGPDPDWRT